MMRQKIKARVLVSCLLAVSALTLTGATRAWADDAEAKRVFPATLAISDAAVGDSVSLPTFSFLPTNNSDGSAGPVAYSLGYAYSKTITPTLGITIGSEGYRWERGPSAQGWANLDTELRYVLWEDQKRETILSTALAYSWANTGSPQSASLPSDSFSTASLKLFASKGLVEAGADWIRPFAISGEFDYNLPTRRFNSDGSINPNSITYGASLQYSLLYMNDHVTSLPEFVRKLIPAFEGVFDTPVGALSRTDHCAFGAEDEDSPENIAPPTPCGPAARVTTGVVGPALYYMDKYFQLGAMAQIPINADSGRHVGVIASLEIYLDVLAPHSIIGKPLFGAPDAQTHY